MGADQQFGPWTIYSFRQDNVTVERTQDKDEARRIYRDTITATDVRAAFLYDPMTELVDDYHVSIEDWTHP